MATFSKAAAVQPARARRVRDVSRFQRRTSEASKSADTARDASRRRPTLGRARALSLGVAVLASIPTISGCGADDDTGQGTSAGVTLIGTYTTTLGPSGAELTEPNPPGTWKLHIISQTEAYLQPPVGERFPLGNPIELSSNRIVFAPDPACPTQVGKPSQGVYSWQRVGPSLAVTEIEDTCRDRAFVLTSGKWTQTGD